ncbi:coiled-coil domain-containing protein 30 isoform X3 [Oryzias latipes]|uniref:Coiled-coil domain containing 30 n=1 Tax=Oryzias latipes TaxID=8090 RepID=A0A3B3HZ33_ORYLA|nr:coiled-coil domain-containing protein 30 isoform X3 [Oryzias latipes]
MDRDEVWTELDHISKRLQEDGLSPEASAEDRQRHLWHLLLRSEAQLRSASQELQALHTEQNNEKKEVESYVEHIRGLLEDRESLTAEYEVENQDLRHELQQIKHQQESQSKELAEMLVQGELEEIALSSPSEQVAYLLVERVTLLERLEAAERKLDVHGLAGNLEEVDPQQSSSQSPWKKLFGLRRSGQNKHSIIPAQLEQVSREQSERLRLEKDLEEASRRLAMAHQDIRRLTSELDAAKDNNQGSSGFELQGTVEEVENLKKEVDNLKHCDMMKLQLSKEENDRLHSENRALKEKLHSIESEKKTLQDQLSKIYSAKEAEKEKSCDPQNYQPAMSDPIHKRCQEAMEDGLVQVKELQRQLQRLRKEQEELEERNEELEALLGEAQNASKEERHRHEGELEGLHRRVRSLEAELKKQDAQEKNLKNGEDIKTTDTFLQVKHLRDSSQERLALLEARLTEEKDWRKQLELDLSAAQTALKKDKEALQFGERELKKLRLEVSGLQTECQQGKTLIKSLTQVKGEKAALEEKLAQMERAHSRLQSELHRFKSSNQSQENQREGLLQVEQLQKKIDQLTAELSGLQTSYNTLREELTSERMQTAELQTKLRTTAQEKLEAEEQRSRLEQETQSLQKQLLWHQNLPSPTKETVSGSNKLHTAAIKDGDWDQLSALKQELTFLQSKVWEEQQKTSQQQMLLEAQLSEAQARIKSQDSVLSQKAEEAKQMKQDLQRAQSLFTSAERELRYEKEKNMDLKRHNALLDQEKLKISAELKQAQLKLVQVEQKVSSQTAEIECQQQKIRELELELARTSTNHRASSSLQEDLQAERARLIAADKKVLELQQQLKNVQHQLRVEEARASESSRLERDSRDLSDNLSALRAQQQEQHIARKLLEQREEELQQQVRSLRLKEASLSRTNTELSHRVQQLDIRLSISETELSKTREEVKESQKSSQKVQEELLVSQQECERLQAELQQVLLQLDANIRKYNEKQTQNKTKLRQAKQVFLKTTAQRDSTIQKLENDLALANSLSFKEKERIQTVVAENEKLLEDKRELLRRISEAEEMGSKGMRTASTVQHRVNILEVENRQLHERTMKLSSQVGSLERALRNVETFYSLENIKKMFPSDGLSDGPVHTSVLSLTSGSCDHMGILDAICRSKSMLMNGTGASVSTQPPSEQGYLNLASPLVPPAAAKDAAESSTHSDQV